MTTGATRSRAAILCFGGWGIQTMLHLAPRLRAAQEQRKALGIEAPDLTRITQFAGLVPDTMTTADGVVPIHLRRLDASTEIDPFFLEQILGRLEKSTWASSQRDFYAGKQNGSLVSPARSHALFQNGEIELGLSDAESEARRLLQMAEPVLQPLGLDRLTGAGGGEVKSASRDDVFRTGMEEGDEIARLLAANVIDPIRQDTLAPGDPFVQTVLYVVAPLYEPLTSALIWPVMSHLLQYLGRRHVSQIVGIFALGSYATNASRGIEDGSTFAALREMESLTGLSEESQLALREKVQAWERSGRGGGILSDRVGESIFDRIYLVDREKSNQGLSQNSYELSALVSNALQALIAAEGNSYVEEQVGIDLRDSNERPYSLLGAAADVVPLDYLFEAVDQQEEKRLVREQVLSHGEDENLREVSSLADLGATPDLVLAQLVARLPDLFLDSTPRSLSQLRVHPSFVLPPASAADLRDLSSSQWQRGFDDHFEQVGARFEALVGQDALDQAWGLGSLGESGIAPAAGDQRLLPATAHQMYALLLERMAVDSAGLYRAQVQLEAWLQEIEAERHALLTEHIPGEEQYERAQRQIAVGNWRGRYLATEGENPSLAGSVLRPTLLLGTIALIAAIYGFVFSRPFDLNMDGGTLIGIFFGLYAGAFVAYRRRLNQLQQLRRERVELARLELSSLLQHRVRRGLLRTYDHLAQMLRRTQSAIQQSLDALNLWSVAEGVPPVPPEGAVATHLYRYQLDEELWERCRSYLGSLQDRQGRHSSERFQDIWGSLAWKRRLGQILTGLQEGRSLPEGLEEVVRETAHEAVSTLSTEAYNPIRAELIRRLAGHYNLEHLLWRAEESPGDYPLFGAGDSSTNRLQRHLEFLWSNAKPSANYEVSDRLATHGITVDLAAVSGDPESDMTEMTLQDFRVARLVTGDPFQITFVRTVHGLKLEDMESSHRYREELHRLDERAWAQIALSPDRTLYGVASSEADEVDSPTP